MNILKPIAFDVIHCVSQLFDYYLYAVYTFFGRNDMVQYFRSNVWLHIVYLCRRTISKYWETKHTLTVFWIYQISSETLWLNPFLGVAVVK